MGHLSLKKLLTEAWKGFRSKYFVNVIVVFLVGVIVGGYSLSTGEARIGTETTVVQQQTQMFLDRATGKSNADVIEEFVEGQELIKINTDADNTARKYTKGVLSVFVNQMSSSGSFGFGILNGINT